MALRKDIKDCGKAMVKPRLRKRIGHGRKGHKLRRNMRAERTRL